MIEIAHISKAFGREKVLEDVGMRLQPGRTLSILGKSGCGKTTLLKILAGLEQADGGSFSVDGLDMMALKPQERGVVYLSQEPLLFPHLTVFENVAFGLRIRKVAQQEADSRVRTMLEQLGLEAQAQKKPGALSGGQRQRVAFGRAIIIQPRVLLLDEPFGSLDVQTRAEMQALFVRLRAQYEMTALFVTHDLKEALVMGDELGRMESGRLKVYGSRAEFVHDPESQVKSELAFWQQLMEEEDGK